MTQDKKTEDEIRKKEYYAVFERGEEPKFYSHKETALEDYFSRYQNGTREFVEFIDKEELQKLRDENEALRGALEFYANENNWFYHPYDGIAAIIISDDLSDYDKDGKKYYINYNTDERPGGKTAREVLAKYPRENQ